MTTPLFVALMIGVLGAFGIAVGVSFVATRHKINNEKKKHWYQEEN